MIYYATQPYTFLPNKNNRHNKNKINVAIDQFLVEKLQSATEQELLHRYVTLKPMDWILIGTCTFFLSVILDGDENSGSISSQEDHLNKSGQVINNFLCCHRMISCLVFNTRVNVYF